MAKITHSYAKVPVLCGYKIHSMTDDGLVSDSKGAIIIHVDHSQDILPEFEFSMHMLARSHSIPAKSQWSLSYYLPRNGYAEF